MVQRLNAVVSSFRELVDLVLVDQNHGLKFVCYSRTPSVSKYLEIYIVVFSFFKRQTFSTLTNDNFKIIYFELRILQIVIVDFMINLLMLFLCFYDYFSIPSQSLNCLTLYKCKRRYILRRGSTFCC
jgi:hypothetical protein